MTQYIYQLALLIPIEESERVNMWLERNGYGPNNVSRPCVGGTHLCVTGPANQQMIDIIGAGLAINPAVQAAVGARDTDVLTPLLEANNLELEQ
jgi:hypothetical protein